MATADKKELTGLSKLINNIGNSYRKLSGNIKEASGFTSKFKTVISSIGNGIKSWWKNLSGLSKFSAIATGVIVAVKAIDAAIVGLSETWEEKVARLEMEISVNDEEIQKLDTEIDELENLQDALEGAKGNKVELAKIYDDLNDKISVSTGLLSGEEKGWQDANEAIEDQIRIREQLRQKLIEENREKYGELFDANGIDNKFLGVDWLAADLDKNLLDQYAQFFSSLNTLSLPDGSLGFTYDVSNDNARMGALFAGLQIKDKTKNDILAQIESGNLSLEGAKEKLVGELMASYGLTSEDWTNFWTAQVNNAYAYFEDAINSYGGYGGKSFAELLIKNAVEAGYGDLDEQIAPLLDYFNTNELNDAIENFKNSLLDNDADTASAASGLDSLFESIKSNYPGIASFLDDYKAIIISTCTESIEAVDSFASTLDKKFKADSFDDIRDFLSSLSPEEFTMVTRAISNGLLDDVSSLEELRSKISVLTDLKNEIGGVAEGFNNATIARNNFQAAMDGVTEYDTNFKSYTEAYKALMEEIEAGTTGSKRYKVASEYLLGEDAVKNYSTAQIKNMAEEGNLKTLYSDAETYGTGLLELLSKIDKESAGLVESWAKKNKDGTYDFFIDKDEIDEVAKALGTTEQGVWSMIEALQMYGNVQLFNTDDIIEYSNELGTLTEVAGKNVINVDKLGLAFDAMGLDISTASSAMAELEKMGYILLDSSSDAETLCAQLSAIGIVSGDAANGFTGNVGEMVASLTELGYGEEAISTIIGKFADLQNKGKATLSVDIDDSILEIINSDKFDDDKRVIFYEFIAENYEEFNSLTPEEKETVVNLIAEGKDVDAWLERKGNIEIIASVTGEDIDSLAVKLEGLSDVNIEAVATVLGRADVEKLSEVFSELEDAEIKAIATAIGTGDVDALKTAIDNLEDEHVQAIAEALGYSDVTALDDAITALNPKTVEAIANVFGISDTQSLKTAIDRLYTKEVSAGAEVYGTPDVSELGRKINGLGDKKVTVWASIKQTASNLWGWVTGKGRVNGTANVDGTAFAKGTTGKAYKNGDWRTKDSGVALGGELGQEVVVRDGRYFTIGDDGAEFFHYKRGDVIFNHKQSAELFKNGKVTSGGGRGKAFLSGTGVGKVTTTTTTTTSSSSNKTSTSSSKTSTSSTEDTTEETIEKLDWIKIALDRVERAINKVKKTATSAFSTLAEKLGATKDEISLTTQEIGLQQQAYERYMQEANSVALSDALKEKVRNGSIDIEEYDKETAELIGTYQEMYEKALDASDAVDDLNESLGELYVRNFENIQEEYDNQLALIEHLTNSYNTGIDELEAKGYLASTEYYKALKTAESQKIVLLEKEIADLTHSMSEAMASGQVQMYDEQW